MTVTVPLTTVLRSEVIVRIGPLDMFADGVPPDDVMMKAFFAAFPEPVRGLRPAGLGRSQHEYVTLLFTTSSKAPLAGTIVYVVVPLDALTPDGAREEIARGVMET